MSVLTYVFVLNSLSAAKEINRNNVAALYYFWCGKIDVSWPPTNSDKFKKYFEHIYIVTEIMTSHI